MRVCMCACTWLGDAVSLSLSIFLRSDTNAYEKGDGDTDGHAEDGGKDGHGVDENKNERGKRWWGICLNFIFFHFALVLFCFGLDGSG